MGRVQKQGKKTVLGLVATGICCAGCGDARTHQTVESPEGAVLRIGEAWVLAEEVDRWLDGLALLEPSQSRSSWRRKVLVNIVVPSKVASQLFVEDRELARTGIEQAHRQLSAGLELQAGSPYQLEQMTGHALEIGLDRWTIAMQVEPGEWCPPYEGIGSFTTLRLLEGPPVAEWNAGSRVTVEYLTIPFLLPEDDPIGLIDEARRAMKVEVVDPDWEWVSPKWLELEE